MRFTEPWVMLRLAAAVVTVSLFVRAAWVALRALRGFDALATSERQLSLEHDLELSTSLARVAAAIQVGSLLLTILAADRLSRGVRGAMCAYGVFQANAWGPRSLALTILVAVGAGFLLRGFALDARVRGLDLVRPLAFGTVLLAPLALLDLAALILFLGRLDLSVTASCCSTQLDGAAAAARFMSGPRVFATAAAASLVLVALLSGLAAVRRPSRGFVGVAGLASVLASPFAIAAIILEVAPYAFEVPQHLCPFCLFRAEGFFLGYPLFGAVLVAMIWGGGSTLGAVLARSLAAREVFAGFARTSLRVSCAAWAIAFVAGLLPIVRYVALAGNASLFR